MHRSDSRSAFFHWSKYARTESSACMQDNFAAQLLCADAGQIFRNRRDSMVRRGDQNDLRREHLARQECVCMPGANKTHSFACARLASRHDGADLPSQLTQAASQRAAHPACTDDRKAPWHYMLG